MRDSLFGPLCADMRDGIVRSRLSFLGKTEPACRRWSLDGCNVLLGATGFEVNGPAQSPIDLPRVGWKCLYGAPMADVLRQPALNSRQPESDKLPDSPRLNRSTYHVLVVDDNKDAATTLGMMVQHFGHESTLAFDGQRAIELTGEIRPDIVLLDIGLPDMNGYEVARSLRESTYGPCPVLIALTGHGLDDDKRRSAEAGFALHLVKPVGLATLGTLLAGIGTPRGVEG